jgi:hypothetical protein
MPLGLGASLPSQEYADIVAFLLAQSGLPAGTDKFTPYSPMDRVLELNAVAAAGGTVAAAVPGQIEIGKLYGKLVQPTTTTPTQAELDAADTSSDNWLMYNKGYRGERYSTLAQIDTKNAGSLRRFGVAGADAGVLVKWRFSAHRALGSKVKGRIPLPSH